MDEYLARVESRLKLDQRLAVSARIPTPPGQRRETSAPARFRPPSLVALARTAVSSARGPIRPS